MEKLMKKLYGVTVALITPMSREDQKIDFEKLEKLVATLIEKGVHSIYCCGTDSEMYHLTTDERKMIVETVVKAADQKVVVYAHCGAMREEDTVALVQHAEQTGADGVGLVTPAYFPMTDDELYAYYTRIAGKVSSSFPVYVYNIPQLAVNDIKPAVVQRIADECENVVGIKYNYPNINQTLDYLNINQGEFSVLQGDDRVLPAWLALGCAGTVAGSANVFPEPLVASYDAYQKGDMKASLQHAKVAAAFVDAMLNDNIAYFKAGLSIRGFDVGTMRSPLTELGDAEKKQLEEKIRAICEQNDIRVELFN